VESLRREKRRSNDLTRTKRARECAQFCPAGLELALLEPEVARELRLVVVDLLDEALSVLAPYEQLDSLAEWVLGAREAVDDRLDCIWSPMLATAPACPVVRGGHGSGVAAPGTTDARVGQGALGSSSIAVAEPAEGFGRRGSRTNESGGSSSSGQ
jgi:hypothetical protein